MPVSNQPRPRVAPQPTRLRLAFEAVAVAAVVGCIVLGLSYWSRLPESIPIHFDASGEPDAWGVRAYFILSLLISSGVYATLTVLNRYPHIFNYPFAITPENAEMQYRLAQTFLAGLKAMLVVAVWFLQWRSAEVAIGRATGTGWLPPIMLAAAFIVMLIIYVVVARRYRDHVAA